MSSAELRVGLNVRVKHFQILDRTDIECKHLCKHNNQDGDGDIPVIKMKRRMLIDATSICN